MKMCLYIPLNQALFCKINESRDSNCFKFRYLNKSLKFIAKQTYFLKYFCCQLIITYFICMVLWFSNLLLWWFCVCSPHSGNEVRIVCVVGGLCMCLCVCVVFKAGVVICYIRWEDNVNLFKFKEFISLIRVVDIIDKSSSCFY